MSLKSTLKDIGSFFLKGAFVDNVKESVKETMEDLEKRTQRIVHNVVRSLIVLIMIVIGGIYALTGLATYLTQTVPSMANGVGYITVGAGLIVLAIFAKLMQRE